MNQYARGFSDIRLTDIATPVNKPAAGAASRFEDVLTDDFFYDAVNWAVEQGVTSGTGRTSFS